MSVRKNVGVRCNGHGLPDAHNVTLSCLHVDVDRPHVPTLGMRVNDAFEDGLAPFWVAQLVL